MADLITKYITITPLKNGGFRFLCTPSNDANVYLLLRSMGYRRIEYNKGYRFALLNDAGVNFLKSFSEIRFAFRDYLKSTQFLDLPAGLPIEIIINWFYEKKNLVRQSSHCFDDLDDLGN